MACSSLKVISPAVSALAATLYSALVYPIHYLAKVVELFDRQTHRKDQDAYQSVGISGGTERRRRCDPDLLLPQILHHGPRSQRARSQQILKQRWFRTSLSPIVASSMSLIEPSIHFFTPSSTFLFPPSVVSPGTSSAAHLSLHLPATTV